MLDRGGGKLLCVLTLALPSCRQVTVGSGQVGHAAQHAHRVFAEP